MATGIPYCDETLNCVVGCTHSGMDGCDHCWARELHDMRHKAYLAGKKLPKQYAKPFSEIQIFPHRIEDPLCWRKPRTIFWNSTSDMFHEKVPFEIVLRMLAVVALTPKHRHLFLTKRPDKQASIFVNIETEDIIHHAREVAKGKGVKLMNDAAVQCWPLPNLLNGLSCSTQEDVDELLPIHLQVPGRKWLSLEPLLSEVDITFSPISWVVVGAESGSEGRPCKPEWIRSIVEQCQAANVPVFVKQMEINGKCVTDPDKFPADLQIREYPR